jgi:FkbM family methyltransferase
MPDIVEGRSVVRQFHPPLSIVLTKDAMPIPRKHLIPFYIRSLCTSWALKCMCAAGIKTVSHNLAGGGQMILDTNDHLARRILCEGAFEPAVRCEIERIASRRGNVVDIGANIGYYTILMSRLVGPDKCVYAFEPQPRVVSRLRANIEASGLLNVTVFPLALSDVAGSVGFHIPMEGSEAHGSIHANGRFEVMKIVDVETQRLDDVLSKLGNPEISLIKMDAEGAELSILRGAARLLSGPNKPVLVFEAFEGNCQPFGYCVYDLLEFVRSFGYRLRQLDKEDWLAVPEPV